MQNCFSCLENSILLTNKIMHVRSTCAATEINIDFGQLKLAKALTISSSLVDCMSARKGCYSSLRSNNQFTLFENFNSRKISIAKP